MLAGAVIAISVKQPLLAVTLAYVSHFALDAIPHFGIHSYKNVFERNRQLWFKKYLQLGALFTVIFVPWLIIFLKGAISFWLLLACVIAAILPDLVWVPRYIQELRTHEEKSKGKISQFHVRIQRDSLVLGGIIEVTFFAGMILLLTKLK